MRRRATWLTALNKDHLTQANTKSMSGDARPRTNPTARRGRSDDGLKGVAIALTKGAPAWLAALLLETGAPPLLEAGAPSLLETAAPPLLEAAAPPLLEAGAPPWLAASVSIVALFAW